MEILQCDRRLRNTEDIAGREAITCEKRKPAFQWAEWLAPTCTASVSHPNVNARRCHPSSTLRRNSVFAQVHLPANLYVWFVKHLGLSGLPPEYTSERVSSATTGAKSLYPLWCWKLILWWLTIYDLCSSNVGDLSMMAVNWYSLGRDSQISPLLISESEVRSLDDRF